MATFKRVFVYLVGGVFGGFGVGFFFLVCFFFCFSSM